MQRRIVFIVNVIFKCPANLTLSTSLLVEHFSTTRPTIYSRDRQRFALFGWAVYRGGGKVVVLQQRGAQHKACGSLPSMRGEMLSVKDTRFPSFLSGPFSAFPSRVVYVCARACADTGIFALAKQGSCIDLCDCDEFGIVI